MSQDSSSSYDTDKIEYDWPDDDSDTDDSNGIDTLYNTEEIREPIYKICCYNIIGFIVNLGAYGYLCCRRKN